MKQESETASKSDWTCEQLNGSIPILSMNNIEGILCGEFGFKPSCYCGHRVFNRSESFQTAEDRDLSKWSHSVRWAGFGEIAAPGYEHRRKRRQYASGRADFYGHISRRLACGLDRRNFHGCRYFSRRRGWCRPLYGRLVDCCDSRLVYGGGSADFHIAGQTSKVVPPPLVVSVLNTVRSQFDVCVRFSLKRYSMSQSLEVELK